MKRLSDRNKYLLASILSGIIFWVSWPPLPFLPLLLVAFVPVLWMEWDISKKTPLQSRGRIFLYSYISFLIWNASTTLWLWNASPAGSVFAVLANSAFMSTVILIYHISKSHLGKNWGWLTLISTWITYEFLHHRWELTWSWLSLGNAPAIYPAWIQWYEYTGIFGGSLLILLVNILSFSLIKHFYFEKNPSQQWKAKLWLKVIGLSLVLILPTLLSFYTGNRIDIKGTDLRVVAIQPNIDPNNEKFPGDKNFIPYDLQLERLINLSKQGVDGQTDYLIWPETAIPGGMDVENLNKFEQIQKTRLLTDQYPNLTLITGIDGYMIYGKEKKSVTARYMEDRGFYFDYFNSAIQLSDSGQTDFYHKSKLVPGVERMPYPGIFSFLETLTIDLGGISGSLGLQNTRDVFFRDSIGIAPVICFESVFGEYVGDYVKNGANAIAVITNDGWWGNTAGHKQHLYFSSLRAIETRKPVIRAANTGISAIIDYKGNITDRTEYWEPGFLKGTITANEYITLYTKHGDLIGRTALLITIISVLITFVSIRTKRFHFRMTKLKN